MPAAVASVEEVHQRAREQNQVRHDGEDMRAVLDHEIQPYDADNDEH